MGSLGFLAIFTVVVLGLLALDLGIFHRQARRVSLKEAAFWTAVWVSLSMLLCVGIYLFGDHRQALEFLTGYLVEEALSVDNLFVFIVIFEYFVVPPAYQHRVLFWGILGALVLRGTLIGFGAFLVSRFHWILYLFGAFLVYTGVKLIFQTAEEEVEPGKNPLLRILRRQMPVSEGYHGTSFFVRDAGRLMATPLLVVLIIVETTDVLFAFDSIPAIFGITRDPLIIYTSNICAILGLRSLYFLLASVMNTFQYLRFGVSAVLVFVGAKMLVEMAELHVPIGASLGVVGLLLGGSVLASVYFPSETSEPAPVPAPESPSPAPQERGSPES
jgi:TerC family integral membrane protein